MDAVSFIETLASHHHHNRNDTTGDSPIPEIPHRDGLVVHSKAGRQTLWVVFVIMLISTFVFFGTSYRVAKKNRLFHNITGLITLFAAFSYYAMASGVGGVLVRAPGDHAYREVLYARYLDWLVTTPLLLMDIALLAGIAPVDIIQLVILDVFMIVTGLVGGLHPHFKLRWGAFTFATIALLFIIYGLVVPGYQAAAARSEKVGKTYLFLSVWTVVIWSAYAVVWALAEGTNYMKADSEITAYAVLDVLAKPVFGTILLISHANIKEANVALPAWFTEPKAGKYAGYSAIPNES